MKRIFSFKKKRHSNSNPNLLSTTSQSPILSHGFNSIRNTRTIGNNDSLTADTIGTSTSNSSAIEIDFGATLPRQNSQSQELGNDETTTRNEDDSASLTGQMSTTTTINTEDNIAVGGSKISQKFKRFNKMTNSFFKKDRKRGSSNLCSEMVCESLNVTEEQFIDQELTESIVDEPSYIPGTSSPENNLVTDIDSSFSTECQNAELEERLDTELEKMVLDDPVPIAIETKEPIISDDDVWFFILNLAQHSASDLSTVLNLLRHQDVTSLYRDFGYNKCILYCCILKDYLRGKTVMEENTVLSSYFEVNERRMTDLNLFNLIEEKTPEILSVKKKLNKILKAKINDCLMCTECHKNMVSILFLPCGHMVLCNKCNEERPGRCKCCRARIIEFHHVFV